MNQIQRIQTARQNIAKDEYSNLFVDFCGSRCPILARFDVRECIDLALNKWLMLTACLAGNVSQPAPDKACDGFPLAAPHGCPQKLWTEIYFCLFRSFAWSACFAGMALQAAPGKALAGLYRGRYTKLST